MRSTKEQRTPIIHFVTINNARSDRVSRHKVLGLNLMYNLTGTIILKASALKDQERMFHCKFSALR